MTVDIVQIGERIAFDPERVSRAPLFQSERVRAMLLCLKEGQALTEHTAPGEAIIHVLSGRVRFRAGEVEREAGRGALFHLPPGARHAAEALRDAVLLVLVVL